jgi:hypothetical protein
MSHNLSQQHLAINNLPRSPLETCDQMERVGSRFLSIAKTAKEILVSDELTEVCKLHALLNDAATLHSAFSVFPTKQLLCSVFERVVNEWHKRVENDHPSLKTEEFFQLQTSLLSFLMRSHTIEVFDKECGDYLIVITNKMVSIANLLQDEGILATAGNLRCFPDLQLVEMYVAYHKQW